MESAIGLLTSAFPRAAVATLSARSRVFSNLGVNANRPFLLSSNMTRSAWNAAKFQPPHRRCSQPQKCSRNVRFVRSPSSLSLLFTNERFTRTHQFWLCATRRAFFSLRHSSRSLARDKDNFAVQTTSLTSFQRRRSQIRKLERFSVPTERGKRRTRFRRASSGRETSRRFGSEEDRVGIVTTYEIRRSAVSGTKRSLKGSH